MKEIKRRLLIPVLCLLSTIGLSILGQFKEDARYDITLPDSPPTAQWAMEDGDFTWDQTGDLYYLQIENTGEAFTKVSVKDGFPWPGYAMIIRPGDTWELAVENAHHRAHTITFENEEGTPSGTIQVWTNE
ncbi:MAG: hypothetical protein IKK50_07165 [Ruminiclostridium sp.]|nr:hypothetical protein [Ruminiclostridium sp.]